MLTNFDLICAHTKKLAQKLMASSENLQSEELYKQYCNSFEQLMAIVESPNETVDEDKLQDMYITVKELEEAFAREYELIKDAMKAEQMKARVNSAYAYSNKIIPFASYNKES